MKAIIPAAGHGTRFLPVTRVVPKEMLPIGAKPALELIVEEARSAGADEIVMVISHGKELIREYFKGDPTVRFVYQEEQRGLGHAVLQAAEATRGSDRVLVLLGDALVSGCNAAKALADVSAANGGANVIGFERVPRERLSRYGVARPSGEVGPDGAFRVADLVEKPPVEEAPSDLAIAGRYLLSAAIFDLLAGQTPGVGGEIQLTDAVRRLIAGDSRDPARQLYGYVYPGRRLDIGNPDGYFRALEHYRENRQNA